MITSKQRSFIGLAALLAIGSTQACGSDDPATSGTAGASQGTAGAHAGAPAGVAGTPAGVAGTPGGVAGATGVAGTPGGVAGAPAGGAPGTAGSSSTAGAPSGGAGGASAGSGGSAGGAGGKGGGGNAGGGNAAGSGGGSTATFAQVTTIINTSCAAGQCHNAASMQVNFKAPSPDLYSVLTTAIPTSVQHCKGTTMVVPGNAASSFLVSVVTAKSTCKNNGTDESIARMPDNCSGNSCLSAAQIKTITDWINAGAPK